MTAVACSGSDGGTDDSRPTVVVTTSILGTLVTEVVGGSAEVRVLIPNGVDPHSWEPSAADIERLQQADLLVVNGLGLEESLEESIDARRGSGRLVFDASSAVDVIASEPHEPEEGDGHDDDHGPSGDPHYWMDPVQMRGVATELVAFLERVGLDASEAVSVLSERLNTVDASIAERVGDLPGDRRVLVTGHDSMAYFARRYDFTVVGAVIPSRSSLAESTAGDIAELRERIADAGVTVVFTEVGTPGDVVDALASDAGVRVVEINPVSVPDDADYVEFIDGIADTVVDALAS